MATIKVKNLSKTFKYHEKSEGLKGSVKALFKREKKIKEAVKNISFEIEKGEFVGFLGPNGAGKTTTLKMLSGILHPSDGTVSVLGFDPSKRKDDFKKKISLVMGQKQQLWPTLPAIETFRLLQKIYEIPETEFIERLNELLKLMNLRDQLHVQVRKLSLGQRMKAELIASLLHHPKVLFLDEPTIGLDIVSQKNIREFLKSYNKKYQTTIILTSHYMEDVQDLCKRIIIINEGELGYDGSISQIIEEYSRDKNVEFSFNKKVLRKNLSRYGRVLSHSSYKVKMALAPENTSETISSILSKFSVKDLNIKDVTLEEVLADLFSKK